MWFYAAAYFRIIVSQCCRPLRYATGSVHDKSEEETPNTSVAELYDLHSFSLGLRSVWGKADMHC